MEWLLALFLAQDPNAQAQAVRTAMKASLEQQRASIQLQFKAPSVISAPTSSGSHIRCDSIAEPQLAVMIGTVALKNNLDPRLIHEVARKESAFRPCAISPKGAEGLMQLMPATQVAFDVRDPFDPQESLDAGAKLLKQLLDRYKGDLSLALSAYNAGAARVDRIQSIPAIPETQDYVGDILDRLKSEPRDK